MKLKKKSLQLGQILCAPFIVFLILLRCGIPVANAQTPQQIAKKALAATVLLVMKDDSGKPLGLGSGFFVDTNFIATNFHVIEGATRGTAKLVGEQTEYPIEVFTAMDETHDLAILQVAVPDVQPLPLGDSDTIEIGDTVYVAGNPKGYFEGTFSDGIISAIRGDSTSKRLQMTAPVSSGSSGGPVINGSGEVIGVSFATFRDGQNLNFAIPSNYLKGLIACTQGITKFNQGQYAAAIVEFDIATRLNPDYAAAYMWRGIVKYELGQRAAAIADFDTVIQLRIQRRLQNRETTKADIGQD
ncbi:trypsin-like serine protease, partial [Candidatus Poribacteria bacterium]|nr:trypsin-like serine protease [Candidatus Poribacteria bacterium]